MTPLWIHFKNKIELFVTLLLNYLEMYLSYIGKNGKKMVAKYRKH